MINKLFVTSALTLVVFAQAQAAVFDFSGNIASHKDVIEIGFTLTADATDVKVWTDSFLSATNFDPITAVWNKSGSDWTLIGENDDNPSIAPGQTWFDSGLVFPTLSAGDYLFTIAAYNNFANSSLLSNGFRFDSEVPIPLADWCEPASHCGMGTFYSVHLSGVDVATVVPEPATYAMLIAGLGLLGFAAHRRNA